MSVASDALSVAVRPARPRLSEPELTAWRGILRAHAAVIKTLDAELDQAHGLPLSSYEVMAALDSAPGRRMRMCDLAASVLLSRSGITRLVDRLERDALVARDSCAQDARGAFAVLTTAGARKLMDVRATHIEAVRRHFLSRFTASEVEALGDLLARLGEGAYELPDAGG
jgi:DNA-binding MarR family transcriptional regulator